MSFDTSTALRGLIIGFSIAAVVGPIGVLCIRRTLAAGFLVGFLSGLGAATADATYGALAAFGVSALTAVLVEQKTWLRLGGGIFLLYLGVTTLRAQPAHYAAKAPSASGLVSAYASTLALTMSNPMTILSFVAIFAGLGLGSVAGVTEAWFMVGGVFVGSALWWLVLASIVGALRQRLPATALKGVNVLSGVVIGAFGVQSLLSVVLGL
jgi:threonine/homoserine/homoserine lactone efflux protein